MYRTLALLLYFSIASLRPVMAQGSDNGASPAGQAAARTGIKEDTQGAGRPVLLTRDSRYRLRIGDEFEITFRYTPEFNQIVTVQPDGFVNLRDLCDLRVEGQTAPEIAEAVGKAYATILHDPFVTVQLRGIEKPYFTASGQVGHPGKYELRSDTTVMQGIAIAGGFNDKAKHSQVLLFRRLSDQWTEVRKLDLKQMVEAADMTEDMHLRGGDFIFVPQNLLSKIERFIPTFSMGIYANPIQ